MKTTILKSFYPNGQIREREALRDGLNHGAHRTWHKNGALATEEHYQNGLLHGVCRQWDESGKLLGETEMVHGTGTQRAWYDNGRLQFEFTTIDGKFCGRSRMWLRDGTLISDELEINNRTVTPEQYRQAAAADSRLPKLRGRPPKPPVNDQSMEKRKFRLFANWLLGKPHRHEAGKWLKNECKARRFLGRFRDEATAAGFVVELYRAGAVEVIAPDIYANKVGDQFGDCLVVRLPKDAAGRKAIREVCATLAVRKLGAFQPAGDIGERYIYLSLR